LLGGKPVHWTIEIPLLSKKKKKYTQHARNKWIHNYVYFVVPKSAIEVDAELANQYPKFLSW